MTARFNKLFFDMVEYGAGDSPTTPSTGEWVCFFRPDGIYVKDDAGTITGPLGTGGGAFWTAVPGSPTRTGNTTFTLTDTGNANLYNKLISKGTCLQWTETSTVKQAMVISATYATDTVTVTIIGDTMASIDANSLKYGAEKARVLSWVYFGTVGATGTDVAGIRFAKMDMKIFGADIQLGTAGSGTTTVDINDDATTMFTTKPSITTTNTKDLNNTANNGTIAAEGSKLTVDFDAVAGTAGVDMYVDLYWTPDLNRYLT